jgi:RNA polymerase sigma factor (sigma-70 family)
MESRPDRARFLTTRWTVVQAGARAAEPERRLALEDLCGTYWYPLYAYARRSGWDGEAARDHVQQFFTTLLARNDLVLVDRERGRFRAWLLAAFRNFLVNERERARAEKRGGGRPDFSLDRLQAETRFGREPADPRTPELAYRRAWAETVLARARAALAEEQARIGRSAHFEALEPALTEQDDAPRHAEVARGLGLSENAVRVALHRLRKRLGELVRAEVAGTLDDPALVEAELAILFEAFTEG